MLSKAKYFLKSCLGSLDPRRFTCLSCGSKESAIVDRKWLVTTLRRCSACKLLFRCPTTTAEEAASFYQTEYSQGATTDLPTTEKLAADIAKGFRGCRNDHTPYIAILKALGAAPGTRVFDYGCSWGYGSWQMAAEGFDVTAYEISRPRAAYAARNLGVRLSEVGQEPMDAYDFFFSAHVIEHVPSPSRMLEDGLRILKPGGVFVAITPNGSDAFRAAKGRSWSSLWGNVHPQLISNEWIMRATPNPCFISSLPVDLNAAASWQNERVTSGDLTGWELCFAVRKT